jgi:hypothetical protein
VRLAVVDKSLQSGGRFYMSNIDIKDVVNHWRVFANEKPVIKHGSNENESAWEN